MMDHDSAFLKFMELMNQNNQKKTKKAKKAKKQKILVRVKFVQNKKIYRDIEIGNWESFHTLAHSIIESINFDCDHLYGFGDNPKNFYRSSIQYDNESFDRNLDNEIREAEFFQKKGDKMSFLFDYGDDWKFEIVHKGEVETDDKMIRIVKTVGEAPEQYPNYDEE